MSWAKKIAGAELYGTGNYIKAGKYRGVIRDVKIHESVHKKATYFLVEYDIQQTTAAEYKPGDSVTWRNNLDQPSGPSNALGFSMAVGKSCFENFDKSRATEKWNESLVALDENPARGLVMDMEAVDILTRAGNPFTKITWHPVGSMWPEDDGEVEAVVASARRARAAE